VTLAFDAPGLQATIAFPLGDQATEEISSERPGGSAISGESVAEAVAQSLSSAGHQ
jgi:hypothetical protein